MAIGQTTGENAEQLVGMGPSTLRGPTLGEQMRLRAQVFEEDANKLRRLADEIENARLSGKAEDALLEIWFRSHRF